MESKERLLGNTWMAAPVIPVALAGRGRQDSEWLSVIQCSCLIPLVAKRTEQQKQVNFIYLTNKTAGQ